MSKRFLLLSSFAALVVVIGCRYDKPEEELNDPPVIPAEYYAGGTTTSFDQSGSAFLHPLANLSADGLQRFALGEALFHAEINPLGEGDPDGLGPLFIQNSCGGCHADNGRSHLPLSPEDWTSGLLLRLSIPGAGVHGEPLGVPGFGGQLQTRAIEGVQAEGQFSITWEESNFVYPDGSTVVLRQPYFSVINPYISLPDFYLRGARLAPPIFGSGLLEAISDETILSLADEMDVNGDGISGKANWVWDVQNETMTLGRFGWKASNPNALQQSAEAFNQDMGITTEVLFPVENGYGQTNGEQGTSKIWDLSFLEVSDVAYYVLTLAPPAPRNLDDPQVMQGQSLFNQIQCAACHTPEIQTGSYSIPELSFQTIRPYSDLLLHDVGAGLGDGRPDYVASANEWRTPPLWGIGLAQQIHPTAGFLHDGRAETIEEAILWHEGEAYESKMAFANLTAAERDALIAFILAL